MVYFVFPLILYSGDCFDQFVILFNFRICVCEFSVQVNCPWQIFVSTGVISLFLFFLFFFFYKSVFCVFVWKLVSMYVHKLLLFFLFSFITLLFPK